MKIFHIGQHYDRTTAALLSDARRGGDTVIAALPAQEAALSLDPAAAALGSSFNERTWAAAGRMPLAGGALQNALAASATTRLLELLQEHRPDVIHLHDIYGGFFQLDRLFDCLGSFKGRIVWTLDDCLPFTGDCAYTDDPAAHAESRACADARRRFEQLRRVTLTTTSLWLKNMVKHSFMEKCRCDVVYKGVNPRIFRPCENDFRKRFSVEEHRLILAVARRWDEHSGLDTLLRLADRLDEYYQVAAVGLTPRQLRTLPQNVIGLRYITNPTELAAMYTTADILVTPTTAASFSIVNGEAMACGTPAVSFDAGGNRELFAEGTGYGTAIPVGDEDALLDAICTLSYTREACLQQAKRFPISHCCEHFAKLYRI
ncbi:MAG: glycosyltransferase [Ruminococcaceae bacterium]|nr:glycosyltransferase [Oscillospiraceae bacterium]